MLLLKAPQCPDMAAVEVAVRQAMFVPVHEQLSILVQVINK